MIRWLSRLAFLGVIVLIGVIGWRLLPPSNQPTAPIGPQPVEALPALATEPVSSVALAPPVTIQPMSDCSPQAFAAAASANAATIDALPWAPFRGRLETGWRTYGPRIADEIGSDCAFESAGFAQALARWQADHRLPADGQLTPDTFQRMRNGWDMARPFQIAARRGCPPAPDPATLQPADRRERFGDRAELVHPGALAAYRQMVADARAAGVANDPTLLTIFSGYRDPLADAARCATGGCGGAERALCSAHRTGTALDLNLGHAPGSRPDSTEDANRLWMSQTQTYRWLVRNAPRYGFVNYAFEPWHWEWAGAPL